MERIIVVKTGTDALLNGDGLDQTLINNLARQIAYLREIDGIRTVIVSSGAIASGRMLEPRLTGEITKRQAAAMFGQPELIDAWRSAFRKRRIITGEALLKDEDIVYLGKPLLEALKYGEVVLNGGDATYDPSTEEEIISRDNDSLSRAVGQIIGADTLIMLTKTRGILDEKRKVIREIATVEDLERVHFFAGNVNGTGGPKSKLNETRNFITDGDKVAYIARAKEKDVILRIVRGGRVGTRVTLPLQGFLPW